jgi:hypothetical protein
MSLTFPPDLASKFNALMAKSRFPMIRDLVRGKLTAGPPTEFTAVSCSDGQADGQPAPEKPKVTPLLQLVFDPGIVLKYQMAARQSRYSYVRYLARSETPRHMTGGTTSPTMSNGGSPTDHSPPSCHSPPSAVESPTVPVPISISVPAVTMQPPPPTYSWNPAPATFHPYSNYQTASPYPLVQNTGHCMANWNGYYGYPTYYNGALQGFGTPAIACC